MNVLEADSVVVRYDSRTILDNVYIKIQQGEVVGLLGRNGCGKSTLLKSVFGAIVAEHKTIRINGEWTNAGYVRSKVKMLPQFDMVPNNIRMSQAMRLFGVDLSKVAGSMPHLLPLLDLRPGQLSGGDRRIAELLLVLYSKSDFCFLDEPFTGLSPVVVERVAGIISEVKKEKGILVTDHLYRVVAGCADRIYSFKNGRLRESSAIDPKKLY